MFEGLFKSRPKTEKKDISELEEEKKDTPNLSRRNFLKGAGSALGVLMLSGIPKFAEASEKKDFENKAMKMFDAEFKDFQERNGKKTELDTKSFERVRLEFMNHFKDRIDFLYKAFDDDADLLEVFYDKVSEYDAQGLMYQNMRKDGLYGQREKLFTAYDENHFYTRAADFLPTSDELLMHEIDPRIGAQNNAMRDHDTGTYNHIIKNIEEYPGWLDEGLIREFKDLLDNPKVRKRFQESNFNLSEVYSTIKAVIKSKNEKRLPYSLIKTDELLVERFIFENSSFSRRELLGPKTDTYIHFNYTDPNNEKSFDGDVNDEMAEIVGVKNVQRIEGTDGEKAMADLVQAILNSTGETFLHFNTHGSIDSIGINKQWTLKIKTIAMALVHRLVKSKDPNELKKITLYFDACHSYDIADDLPSYIEQYYKSYEVKSLNNKTISPTFETQVGVKFEDLPLPTIISSAQKGSLGFTMPTSFEPTVKNNFKALKKEGALTGGFLLRRIQPRGAYTTDMTVFAGKRGNSVDIAGIDQQRA